MFETLGYRCSRVQHSESTRILTLGLLGDEPIKLDVLIVGAVVVPTFVEEDTTYIVAIEAILLINILLDLYNPVASIGRS
jgi:hypothetical protein